MGRCSGRNFFGRQAQSVCRNVRQKMDRLGRCGLRCHRCHRAQGVTITDKSFGCDDTWQAWTADPDGVKIELFEYTDKSAQFVGGDRVATW